MLSAKPRTAKLSFGAVPAVNKWWSLSADYGIKRADDRRKYFGPMRRSDQLYPKDFELRQGGKRVNSQELG